MNMATESGNRLAENLISMTGGIGGGTIGYVTFGSWLEALMMAAACALVGMFVKELYNYCKRKIRKNV